MKIRSFVAVAAVVAAVATTAACGSDDEGVPPVPTAASATSASTGADPTDEMTNPDDVPSVSALNDMLEKALDPKVPASQKTDLVEDAQKDPKLFDQLVKAKKDNPDVTYRIKAPVTKNGPKKAKVKVVVKIPDQPANPIDASIVFDGGRWKLSKATVCPLLSMAEVQSPLCPDNSTSASKSTTKKKSSN